MTRERKDEYVGTVERESTLGTDPASAPLAFSIASVDLSTIRQAEIDDPSYTVDGGKHETIVGLWYPEVSVPLSVKMEGLQTSPASPNPAVATAQTHLIETVLQSTAKLTKTAAVAAAPAPSATEFTTDVTGSHTLSGGGTGIVAVEVSGKYYPRPYTESSDVITLKMAAPGIPVTGDDLLAAAIIQYENKPTTTLTNSVHFVGNDDLQNRKIYGSVGTMTVPEAGPSDTPMLEFDLKASHGARNFTEVRATPATQRGRVFAGSEVLLAIYNNSGVAAFCAQRFAITKLRDDWIPDECVQAADDAGVANWLPGKEAYGVDITVPHDFVPSDLTGGVAASWYEAWTSGETKFHIMCNYGQKQPGFMQSYYFEHSLLLRPDDAEVNEQDGRTLHFVCATPIGSTEHEMIEAQS